MSFMNNLKSIINEGSYNETRTENGAVAFRTTGKELVDLNFAVASMRKWNENEIISKWNKAYYEDKLLAVTWLFFASDVRGGLGERRLFRIIFKDLASHETDLAIALIDLVPEYSRWDNIFVVYGINDKIDNKIHSLLENQLNKDMENIKKNKSISLLAKWMPSVNTSSNETKSLARKFCKMLGVTERQYRKMLASMRKYLDVTEVKTSSNRWEEIDYSKVPSKANIKYNSAFLSHDEDRRREFLNSLSKGETKINASVLFPHDIVHRYGSMYYRRNVDIALEEMWKALPDYVNGSSNTMVVVDGSGSMGCTVDPKSRVTAHDVANALAIYFSERCTGEFKDNFITFSMAPTIVNMTKAKTLAEKLYILSMYTECSNTNIEAVFDLILNTAIYKHMSQKEMPDNILIISDMEFDSCAKTNSKTNDYYSDIYGIIRKSNFAASPDPKLFETISKRYENNGYRIPRLVFWNVNSRSGAIPMKENELGVTLVSGFSAAISKMVLSNQTDPYKAIVEQLMDDRYKHVRHITEKYIR